MSTSKVRAGGDILRAARHFLNLDQDTLAAAAGVARPTISALERGASDTHESTRSAIQTALENRGICFTNGGKPGFYFDRDKAIIPLGS